METLYLAGWGITALAAYAALLLHEGIPETFGDWVVAIICLGACICLGALWPAVWGVLLLAGLALGVQALLRKLSGHDD